MLINADCTLYCMDGSGYKRQVLEGVYWADTTACAAQKSGVSDNTKAVLYIQGRMLPPMEPMRDIVVKGICTADLSGTEAEVSAKVKELRTRERCYCVLSVSDYSFGGLPHFEIALL